MAHFFVMTLFENQKSQFTCTFIILYIYICKAQCCGSGSSPVHHCLQSGLWQIFHGGGCILAPTRISTVVAGAALPVVHKHNVLPKQDEKTHSNIIISFCFAGTATSK